jgi:hypothetical protein
MTIKPDHTGTTSWNNGPCSSRPSSPNCSGNASLRFVPSRAGVIGTYTRVWFTTWDGTKLPEGFDPGLNITAGDKFELAKIAPGLLKMRYVRSHLSPEDTKYGNPYWCGDEISSSHQNLCGA